MDAFSKQHDKPDPNPICIDTDSEGSQPDDSELRPPSSDAPGREWYRYFDAQNSKK